MEKKAHSSPRISAAQLAKAVSASLIGWAGVGAMIWILSSPFEAPEPRPEQQSRVPRVQRAPAGGKRSAAPTGKGRTDRDIVTAIRTIENALDASEMNSSQQPCAEELFESQIAEPHPKQAQYREALSLALSLDKYPRDSDEPGCNTRDEGDYESCLDDSGKAVMFKFTFGDPSGSDEPKSRFWTFLRPGEARQEIEIRVTDQTDARLSRSRDSYIRLFPRVALPSILLRGEVLEVTLPTGEKANFDAKTKAIRSGVITESPLGVVQASMIQYKGRGVVLQANRTGDDPRIGNTIALISKPSCQTKENCKPCQVPVGKLWTNDKVDPEFLFPSDGAFDEFLKKTCGFSMF